MRLGLLSVNPATAVRPPRKTRPTLTVPEPSHVKQILNEARGTSWHGPIALIAFTGLRRGECLGLRWRDVDLDAAQIHVTASLQPDGALVEPKTSASRRTVALPPTGVELLRRVRAGQLERRLLAGKAWRDEGVVFDRGDGAPVDPGRLSHVFHDIAARAGYPNADSVTSAMPSRPRCSAPTSIRRW